MKDADNTTMDKTTQVKKLLKFYERIDLYSYEAVEDLIPHFIDSSDDPERIFDNIMNYYFED
jgi:hypothetical protein